MIAVVEDDLAVLNSLEFSLEAEGFDVRPFDHVKSALASPEVREADCLVIDYALPDGDGLSLLRSLRRRGVVCPAIIIASTPSIRCRREAEAAGAPLVEKPLIDDRLGELIRGALKP
jgi:FixJ family two-component response regulator